MGPVFDSRLVFYVALSFSSIFLASEKSGRLENKPSPLKAPLFLAPKQGRPFLVSAGFFTQILYYSISQQKMTGMNSKPFTDSVVT